MNKKEERIFERNPDTGGIRSRRVGDHGNERIDHDPRQDDPSQLDEIWAAPKVNHQGHWYVRLADVCRIMETK